MPDVITRTRQPLGAQVAAAPSAWVRLNFTLQQQQQPEWCWAAVAASVSLYKNAASSWTQCKLANAVLQLGGDCCTNGGDCNKGSQLDVALGTTGNLRAPAVDGSLRFTAIKGEIMNEYPVGAHITFASGASHFVVVTGYRDDDPPSVAVQDPELGDSDILLDQFISRYRWNCSYLTQ